MITKDEVITALKNVRDPEVGMDIWTMGLVYNIEIKEEGAKNKEQSEVKIRMTYTTPFCPWGPQLNEEVTTTLKESLGIKKVDIEITFDPPYTMPEDLRAMMGI